MAGQLFRENDLAMVNVVPALAIAIAASRDSSEFGARDSRDYRENT